MYKNHIKEWAIGKRLCDDDILAILDLRACLGAAGKKEIEFWIRGHRANERNISRYLRRKPDLKARFLSGHRASSEACSQVVCKSRASAELTSHPVRPMAASDALLTKLELFLVDCRDYIRGSFDSGSWMLGVEGDCFCSLDGDRASQACDNADQDFTLALQSLDERDFEDASRLLESCWSHLAAAMALEDPYFLETFISIAVNLIRSAELDHLESLLRTLIDGALIVHGESHKLTGIITRLQGLVAGKEKSANGLVRVFVMLEDEAERALGKGSMYGSVMLLTGTRLEPAMAVEPAASHMRKHLDLVGKAHQKADWAVSLKLEHTWDVCLSKCELGRLEDAEKTLRGVEKHLVSDFHRASYHSAAGDLYTLQNDFNAARVEYEMALEAAERHRNEGIVRRCLKNLEYILEKGGDSESADIYRWYAG